MPTRSTATLLPPELVGTRVRLRTLVNLRWFAVAGQGIAVIVAELVLGVAVPLWPCVVAIAALAATNFAAQALYPANHRMSLREASALQLFDLAQLVTLLALTGGLNNPFALLLAGPVTLAATTLTTRATVLIGVLVLVSISLLAGFHLPLVTHAGEVIALPRLQLVGFWTANVLAVTLFGAFARRVTTEGERLSRALLATQTALSREQKLHDLGGVVAAAAHELGTPLATIKLVSAELAEEIDDPDALKADAQLIREQADRCRDILRSMGRAGKDDLHLRAAPLESVVAEAAEPHADRGPAILYDFAGEPGTATPRPRIRRAPEVIHGLRNVIQNAVDFAAETVRIEGRWDAGTVRLRIEDDGPGYPPELIRDLGDPFLRARSRRGDYDGMGLGLFISKTLLERTGAELRFANRRDRGARRGASVEISWPRARIETQEDGALGANPTL